MSKIVELFSFPIKRASGLDWSNIIDRQYCPYTKKRCFKVRKSEPEISIGTCVVKYGTTCQNIIICPHRMLQNNQIFFDCIHLLTSHQPGNELHIVPEVAIPGGNVDYFLVSTDCSRKVMDFVGIEIQTMDTTGSIWSERQMTLYELGCEANMPNTHNHFGMNWKMTAKTILVQLHHKIQTFQSLNKHLVLVLQKPLLNYIQREFNFSHISATPKLGDPMQIHSYTFIDSEGSNRIKLDGRLSTDSDGISVLLGLNPNANVRLDEVLSDIESKISDATLLEIGRS